MPVFNNVIIRAELYVDDVQDNNYFVVTQTGKKPAMYSGAQVEFQFCIFSKKATTDSDAVLYDISNISGNPKLRVRATNASGTVLMDESVATTVLKDATTDLASWNNGTKQHFKFYFPETATGITAGTQYIVVYSADGDVFGRSQITVIDPGTGAASSPTPSAVGYYDKNDVNSKLQDYVLKQRPTDQGDVYYALNQTTGKTAKISVQPIFDDGGARLVTSVEYID